MRDETAPRAAQQQAATLLRLPLSTDTPPAEAGATPTAAPRWAWARQWEFWLALALAAFLRLWQVNTSSFLNDQAGLMELARGGILQGALPLTGIPSSIGTLNPPTAIYLIMPFAYVTKDPLGAIISIAVWNVLGVALCYIFALRYFGRRVAVVGTLLFATCGDAINYSRFLWQQNYLAPLVALWAITLFAGCVRGRRGWFVANATLICVMGLLHPVAALLIPVTVVGFFLAPRRPRAWEYVVFLVIAGALAAPTLIYEVLSGWPDARILLRFGAHGSSDLSVFTALYVAIGGPSPTDFGPAAPIYQFRQVTPIIHILAMAFVALGYLALTLRVWRPALAIWRNDSLESARASAPGSGPTYAQAYRRASPRERLALGWQWIGAVYRGLRSEASWRAQTLLWLWVTLPIVGLLHHSSPVYAHYMMILYPGVFIVAAFAALDAPGWLVGRRREPRSPFAQLGERARVPRTAPRWATRVIGVTVVALALAQAAQSAVYTASVSSPAFQAFTGHGYPLNALEDLDGAITTLARQQGASSVTILTINTPTYRAPLEYMLVSEHPDRQSVTQNCLLMPAPNAGPTLIVDAVAPIVVNPAAALLSTLPNVHRAGALPVAGSAPLQAYLAQGATPALPGEAPLAVSYHDSQGDALTLVGATITGPGQLRLRWRIDAAPAGRWFRFTVQAPGQSAADQAANIAAAGASGAPSEQDDCQPTRWAAGETLFTWLTYPTTTTGALSVTVGAGELGLATSALGPFHFIADATPTNTLVPLAPTEPAPSIPV